jgi:hypothetical protein
LLERNNLLLFGNFPYKPVIRVLFGKFPNKPLTLGKMAGRQNATVVYRFLGDGANIAKPRGNRQARNNRAVHTTYED